MWATFLNHSSQRLAYVWIHSGRWVVILSLLSKCGSWGLECLTDWSLCSYNRGRISELCLQRLSEGLHMELVFSITWDRGQPRSHVSAWPSVLHMQLCGTLVLREAFSSGSLLDLRVNTESWRGSSHCYDRWELIMRFITSSVSTGTLSQERLWQISCTHVAVTVAWGKSHFFLSFPSTKAGSLMFRSKAAAELCLSELNDVNKPFMPAPTHQRAYLRIRALEGLAAFLYNWVCPQTPIGTDGN